MADDHARALAWLTANPSKGYKACARALGLPLDQVTAWGKEHRGTGSVMALANPAPPARAREPEPMPPPAESKHRPAVTASRLDRLEWQLDAAIGDLEAVRDNPKGTTAMGALHSAIAKLGDELDQERARLKAEPAEAAMTEDELVEELADTILELGPDHFDRIAEVVDQRRGGLRVVGA